VTLSQPTSATPGFTAPAVGPGGVTLAFELVLGDGTTESAPDRVEVKVRNANDPPACGAAQASLARLWPPDHKLVPIQIVGVADPEGDAFTTTIKTVTQDEPINGLGDGDTGPDAVIQAGTVLIRAERSGTGNGRVYRISFSVEDSQGGTCGGTVTVGVPHSNQPGLPIVDDGQRYKSTSP
jgi:hypothetical protein